MRGYDGSDREYTSGLCRDMNDGSKQGAYKEYFGIISEGGTEKKMEGGKP